MTIAPRPYIFLVLISLFSLQALHAADTKMAKADIKKVDSLNALAFDLKRTDVAKALNNLFVAENIAISVNYQQGLATTYLYEGGIYHQNGYDKRALSTYYKAQQLQNIERYPEPRQGKPADCAFTAF